MPGAAGLPHALPAQARLLDAAGLAERLSVSVLAVRAMVRRRQVPPDAIIKLGRRLRFDEAVIDRWLGWLRADAKDRLVNPTSSGGRK